MSYLWKSKKKYYLTFNPLRHTRVNNLPRTYSVPKKTHNNISTKRFDHKWAYMIFVVILSCFVSNNVDQARINLGLDQGETVGVKKKWLIVTCWTYARVTLKSAAHLVGINLGLRFEEKNFLAKKTLGLNWVKTMLKKMLG